MILKKEFTYKQSLFSSGYPAFQRDARFENEKTMNELDQYKRETEIELERILAWWIRMTIDEQQGGFYGKIDHNNVVDRNAPKGSVLNSRILWAFSSAFNLTGGKKYLEIAERAFDYINRHFIDREFGGVYWTVDFKGEPLNTKKQIYALAFAIYGLSEYYLASQNEEAKKIAVELYRTILVNSYDRTHGGYIEALSRDWLPLEDFRLSAKDANEKKSMNTHLHLLEAFANLYKIGKDDSIREKLIELVNIFLNHIIDKQTNHLILFFDEKWDPKSRTVSYGHDIEAAWLMQEAADLVDDQALLYDVKKRCTLIAEASSEGLDEDGGLWYEYDTSTHHLINEKHSWPQAEAMVGFFNAWQNTGEDRFLMRSLQSWHFVKNFMIDGNLGEWYWGVNADHSPMVNEEKVGIWKCPYHNSRACMEIIRRVQSILRKTI